MQTQMLHAFPMPPALLLQDPFNFFTWPSSIWTSCMVCPCPVWRCPWFFQPYLWNFFLYDTYFTYKAKHLNAYVCKIIFFQKTCEHLPVHSSLSSFGWKAACHTCLVVSFLNVVFSKPMKKQSLCEQRWAIFEHASQEQVLYVNTRGLLHLPIL